MHSLFCLDIHLQQKCHLLVQVYISHKWKFIFLRQPKSSSTAVLVAIKQQLCQMSREPMSSCDELGELGWATQEEILDDSLWEEYFVFTFVRNPWTRMLSAFNYFNDRHLDECHQCLRRYALPPPSSAVVKRRRRTNHHVSYTHWRHCLHINVAASCPQCYQVR